MSTLAQRAEKYATELEAVNDEIVATVTNCTDEQWRKVTSSEGWPVGVVAHHMAQVQGFFAGLIQGVASEETGPMNFAAEDVDANNAQHARDFANVGKQETLDELQTSRAAILQQVRSLSDEQLDSTAMIAGGQAMSAAQVLDLALIAHFGEHLASIRATIAD